MKTRTRARRAFRRWWARNVWLGKNFLMPGEIADKLTPTGRNNRWDD